MGEQPAGWNGTTMSKKHGTLHFPCGTTRDTPEMMACLQLELVRDYV